MKQEEEFIKELNEKIKINENLAYRIIEEENGEFKKVRDDVLKIIILEIIDELAEKHFNNPKQEDNDVGGCYTRFNGSLPSETISVKEGVNSPAEDFTKEKELGDSENQ
ncbi:hypothetical protein [Lutibacter sp.]|uniref:hypothetical protein n=1 Tax=Lutibacter sp. TaxID=1925666 RepID=UPI0034A00DC0